MNILDILAAILAPTDVKLGSMPATPDTVLALQEYPATPPEHSFGGTDLTHNVQLRSRAADPAVAYAACEDSVARLNRYHDNQVSILQTTPILDIGWDDNNPPRQEYTVNFIIRRI